MEWSLRSASVWGEPIQLDLRHSQTNMDLDRRVVWIRHRPNFKSLLPRADEKRKAGKQRQLQGINTQQQWTYYKQLPNNLLSHCDNKQKNNRDR